MSYQNYVEWEENAGAGDLYTGDDHPTVVKLENLNGEMEEYKVQIYSDGYCNFYYGVDCDGVGLYFEKGVWVPYKDIEYPAFPNFVETLKTNLSHK